MRVAVVTVEGNIGAGKTTLSQKFEQSLSGQDNVRIKVEDEHVKEFQRFNGNDLINPPETFYENPAQTRNCSGSLQAYCHGPWSSYLPDIYHCEQG